MRKINDLDFENLLKRETINRYQPFLKDQYSNEVILVTGAAGSIGSEIAKQITNYNYKKLILLDVAESPLYNLEQELIRKEVKNYVIIISNISDAKRLNQIFKQNKPTMVFHAAAYKHVPLMEKNPYEALRVNIVGTKNLADLSVKYNVTKFVLVSTDKVVNPTNVMGASKHIAELYINYLQNNEQTKFIITRFGNVLGSNGSVIPLFKNQIEKGGPITVTHKHIKRYFMTISEAIFLLLKSASLGNGGEIFVFDMGASMKILDLAKNMIVLFGLRYPEDIDIKISGLRPGDKIDEELLADDENWKHTDHEKIILVQKKYPVSKSTFEKINELCSINSDINNLEIVSFMMELIPKYNSNNSQYLSLNTNKAKNYSHQNMK